MIDETILREHYSSYILCFSASCPLHEHCLRWQVAQCPTSKSHVVTAVNPAAPTVGTSDCEHYRDDQPVRVAIGMVRFFREMPHYKELAIKRDIIRHFTRTRFYRMRRGDIPVTPDDQQVIAAICRRHGWTEAPAYDDYEQQYLW